MKILFLTKYNELGPSSRYRVYQYLPLYQAEGIETEVSPLFESYFFSKNKGIKVFCTFYYYMKRFFKLFQIFRYDFVYIEYEIFPYFPAFFEQFFKSFGIKYIVDYDDAIFHNYNTSTNFFIRHLLSNKIDKVISNAFHIITGSPYLTHYVSKLNFNVTEIPTSVSHHNYHNKQIINDNKKFIIGWIGSKTTSVNVIKLIPALEQLSNYIDFQLNLIGFDIELKDKLNLLNVNFINWNAEIEIKEIKKFNVGIMPLENTMFNHGKCGFKLVQYMGCFLPTISSPLEANVKINRNKKNLHATTDDEWLKAFMEIYNNQSYFKEVGVENYNTFINHYTIEKNSQYYLKIFSTVK